MKTKTSKSVLWFRSLIILPLLAILIYGFSKKLEVEKEVASFDPLTIQETDKGATKAMMKEYIEFINEVEKTNTISLPKLNRAKAIYDIMTEAQRATVKKLPKTPLSNLSTVKQKTPTVTEFNSWKNKKKFAIWIDGKYVDNAALNNYSALDFKYYTSSFVYNNARSEKFPQPYQNHLYTNKGFEENYLKRNVNNYNSLKSKYLKAKEEFINSNKKDDSELRILKARLDKLYNLLSKEDIKTYNIETISSVNSLGTKPITILINKKGELLVNDNFCKIENLKNHLKKLSAEESGISNVDMTTDFDAPKGVISNVKNILRELGILEVNFKQLPINNYTYYEATPKQLAEYNKLAKIHNTRPENQRIIKVKDFKHLKFLYSLMSKKQKDNAEPFPSFPPPPPPPPPTKSPQFKNGKKLTLNEIIKKTPKNIESGYEMLDNGESHYFTLYKGKKTYYNKDGYITDEKGNVLPPPPPPPIEGSNQNLSEELQKIKQDYNTKSEKYANAIGLYVKENNGDPAKIKMLYNETMVIYKQYTKLAKKENALAPPPPPPAPISPLDHVIKMAKKGATFYYNDKKITSDKAIELLKKNEDLNISTNTNDGISVVKIQTEPITISH